MIFIPEQPVISQYFVTLKHPSHAQKLKKSSQVPKLLNLFTPLKTP